MTTIAKIDESGALRFDADLLKSLKLKRGASVLVQVESDQIIITPATPEDAWYWSSDWQRGEREADEDLKAGRFTRYMSDEDFLASFNE
ncbi:AbrB/MazE/SpoVT family DNA-binding domain-containing protein [Candidatus Sumerlaeota bacterium]|nr:AbrB/MazE/SpoVT family DNA-binding domain-containing protein [Candidatus Sumerlaeota bacterium]